MNNSLMRLGFASLVLFAVATASAQNKSEFCNPILAGFYPDPSICRVGKDYYLVTSTFSYFPGIPVFQSRNLVNWKLIGYVMDRPEQLNLDGQGVTRGLFAPSIRYNKGLFYVTCTQVDRGGNFIVTAQSAAGPWSNPVWLPEINGIDPSPFFDDDGKAYILYNSIPPDDKSLYDGHRTIRMFALDINTLKVIGEEKILVDGGVDITKKPIWIEAPHIFKKDGSYYLIAAEGGTAEQHSEVVFRSNSVGGPYVPFEKNPILTQRHLDPRREFPITSTGHADFVQTESGSWWAVFLGCRPYRPFDQNYVNTGRETFLAPVEWQGEWPVINPGYEKVQYHYHVPIESSASPGGVPHGGNFVIKDDFNTADLNSEWAFLRTPRERWYDLKERKGWLAMRIRQETCADAVNPSFLGHRQQHAIGSASVSLQFSPNAENEKAGLLIFQNETHFYYLCKSILGGKPVIQLLSSETEGDKARTMQLVALQELDGSFAEKPVGLKIEAQSSTYSFLYSTQKDKWTLLKYGVDARFLSTRVAGGFVGCMYALYATSLGIPSTSTAYFDWFEYAGNDEAYRSR
ncbi:MAG: glycoside hydrolase family 43 protein [Ignavibacteria bacterium]|nr:glycoside hydrolase family 43 protein [Ignavibacteria bacterium]